METEKLTVPDPVPARSSLSLYFGLGVSLLAGFSWVVQSKASLSGFWSLPLGLFQTELTILSLVGSLFGGLYLRNKIFGLLFLLNLFILLSPYSLSSSKKSQGVAVLSWNVSGTNKLTEIQEEKVPCLIDYLSEWKNGTARQVIFLQEVRKSQAIQFEEALEMDCSWSHYLCEGENCNGLLLCADQEWNVNRQRQRPFHSGQRYGFQQLELEDKNTGQKINAINIHLESLWRTISSLPNIRRFGTMSEIVRSNPDPKLFLQALEANAKNQRAEIDALFKVLNQLQDPILLAGDFNAPPSLWFHRYLRREYQDAHVAAGHGFGHTTSRLDFLQMRVDYLYASEEFSWTGNASVDYQTHCSDHFPVQSFVSWGD